VPADILNALDLTAVNPFESLAYWCFLDLYEVHFGRDNVVAFVEKLSLEELVFFCSLVHISSQ